MTQNPPDMKIRLSVDLRKSVEEAAKQNNRTLNSEIVSRLEASFRNILQSVHETASVPAAELQEMAKKMKRLEERITALERRN